MTFQRLKTVLVTAEAGKLELERSRLLGSFFMVLSGFLLYLDKAFSFFNFIITIPHKFIEIGWDQSMFIWFAMQTLTPLMICVGAWLKAYKASIFVPIYAWVLQGYFLLFDAKIVDTSYLSLYVLGTAVLLVISVRIIDKITKKALLLEVKKRKKRLVKELN